MAARQVALLVSEHTLLPVLMPLAPAATLLDRFPDQLGAVLRAHEAPELLIASEIAHTKEHRVGHAANRSIVGSVTEFAHLADPAALKSPIPTSLNCPCSYLLSPADLSTHATSAPAENSPP